MSDSDIFLDLFIHRMNMKESQGVERSRIKIKGGIRTKKGVHPSTPMGNFRGLYT